MNITIHTFKYLKPGELNSYDTMTTFNYWIFQGNPSLFRIVDALRDGVLSTWRVAAHRDKIN